MKILTLNKPDIADFAKARNDLLNKLKNDEWALFLDKDEKLNSDLRFKIYEYESYYLKRKNYFLGKYVGADKIIRLVKKRTGKWQRAVHETWIPNSNQKRGIRKEIIIHNTADNLKDYLNKINNYSTIHARENKKESKTSSIFKIIFYPLGKFILTFIKSKNIVFSIMQSLHSFLAWVKLYLHQF